MSTSIPNINPVSPPRKHRAGAVLIHGGQLLVIWRSKFGREFYVLPGGETEPGETSEQAVIRELAEETSIVARVDHLLYEITYTDLPGYHHTYFLCQYLSGEPALRADAEEQEDNAKGNNIYRPMWLPIDQLPQLTLYPLEIRDNLIEDIPANFRTTLRTISIEWALRRQ